RDGVMEVRLAHAPLNEIGREVLAGLEQCLDEVERSQPGALLVYSDLPRGFCAGADLRGLYFEIRDRPARSYLPEVGDFLDRVHRVMNRLDCLPVTTVGAIHGPCFGGGFELALTLDVLVADASARFCFPELRLGLIPGFGGVPRLRRELPNAVIRDLLLTGRSINAKRAAELGLVSQVVAVGQALEVARATARQAARFAPEVVASSKAFVKPLPDAELAEEKRRFLELFAQPRVAEALRRFVESEDKMPYLPPGER
ncbi:MAG: enoyl-CoA hydratase/isomerase family protein, partial [Polyangiales bacterium]